MFLHCCNTIPDLELVEVVHYEYGTLLIWAVTNIWYLTNVKTGGNPLVLPYDDDDHAGQNEDQKPKKASVKSLQILETLEQKFENSDIFA